MGDNKLNLVLETEPNFSKFNTLKKDNQILDNTPDDKDGLSKKSSLTNKQRQWIRIDKHGDLFTNFFSNFLSQFKNPYHFNFLKLFMNSSSKRNKNKLNENFNTNEYQLINTNKLKNNKNMENVEPTKNDAVAQEFRYDPNKIDWELMANIGLSERVLIERNLLDPLLKGYKTNELVPLAINIGPTTARLDARLSLQTNELGDVVVAIHGIRKEPNLNYPLFGHEFTDQDKDNLLKTQNMGRVVDLVNPKTDAITPSVISIDRLTNELVAFPVERMKIPEQIKGVVLDDSQKQILAEGKPLFLEGMLSKKGTNFDATVQFNADKRFVEFIFDKNTLETKNVEKLDNSSNKLTQDPPKTFRGKELTDIQYEKFKKGETIYMDGLVDKKGQTYQGYISFDFNTQKTSFKFPNQMREDITPMLENKVESAVNTKAKKQQASTKKSKPLDSNKTELKAKLDKAPEKEDSKTVKSLKKKGRKL